MSIILCHICNIIFSEANAAYEAVQRRTFEMMQQHSGPVQYVCSFTLYMSCVEKKKNCLYLVLFSFFEGQFHRVSHRSIQ